MIAPVILPHVRRAILDFLDQIGGEQSDDTLALLLNSVGHRVARRDVADQLRWLGEQGLLDVEQLGDFVVARVLPDGIDAAHGRLLVEGLGRHKTGRAGTAVG
jgi:hypothetical protein